MFYFYFFKGGTPPLAPLLSNLIGFLNGIFRSAQASHACSPTKRETRRCWPWDFQSEGMVKFKINRIIDQLIDSYYTDGRFDVLFLFVAAFRASRDENEKSEEIQRMPASNRRFGACRRNKTCYSVSILHGKRPWSVFKRLVDCSVESLDSKTALSVPSCRRQHVKVINRAKFAFSFGGFSAERISTLRPLPSSMQSLSWSADSGWNSDHDDANKQSKDQRGLTLGSSSSSCASSCWSCVCGEEQSKSWGLDAFSQWLKEHKRTSVSWRWHHTYLLV